MQSENSPKWSLLLLEIHACKSTVDWMQNETLIVRLKSICVTHRAQQDKRSKQGRVDYD